jgi:hypothetical protein
MLVVGGSYPGIPDNWVEPQLASFEAFAEM